MANNIDQVKAEITAHQARGEEFRRQVRELLISQWFDGEWCVPGIQAVLKELGLPAMTLDAEGSVLIRVNIDAITGVTDQEDAEARVASAFSVICSDPDITWTTDLVEPCLDVDPVNDRSTKDAT
ncbi:MAG TPA: hypothetical protein VFG15_03305 [Amycolatopsis sp.]|nr:hypothetical protein [Amycolatopsis sp.]